MNGISKTKSFLLALIVIIGLIFLNFPNVVHRIKNYFYSVSNPAQKAFDGIIKRTKNSWEFLRFLKNIFTENTRLEEKIQELIAQNTQLKELEKENEFLRSYLKLPQSEKYQIYLANIVGRDFQGLESYILIDQGSKAGIKKQMPVIVFNNILIGMVVEVFDDFSKIRLITSSNSKIPVLIQESRAEGLIEGTNEDVFFINLIAKDVKVEAGQTVITSGMGEIFPRGLLIGSILSAESKENEMFQRIKVTPAAEIKTLERVFIIKK